MVPELARMSVFIKSDHETNIITGNYEMAYVCGLLCHLADKTPLQEFAGPMQMQEYVLQFGDSVQTEDAKVRNLIRMLKLYKPDENFDDQVKELFQMGLHENRIWKR